MLNYNIPVMMFQTSPESPLVFSFLLQLFSGQSLSDLKKKALEKVTEDEYTVSTLLH